MDVAQAKDYAVGWGTLALINAGLAESKNRSRLAWFLLSLILGPVATILIVITDPPRATMKIILLISVFLSQSYNAFASSFDVVESRNGQISSFRKWKEKNITFVDWNHSIGNQGAVGSCQSFAFLGILENQVYQEQGVTLALSERYQLYSNFMEFGVLGSDPKQIEQFPQLFAKWGALPEILYPYSSVNKNSAVFEVDSAQGLQNGDVPEIVRAIAGKEGLARSSVLQEERFLGQLPQGSLPVSVPVLVSHIDKSRPMRYVLDNVTNEEVPCFSITNERAKISLSAVEYAAHCLEYRSSDWIVTNHFNALAAQISRPTCLDAHSFSQILTQSLEERRKSLVDLLARLVIKRAGMIAFSVPVTHEGKKSVLWDAEKRDVHAGHAVVALGFLTSDDLNNPAAQTEGFLGSGLFDQMASKYDTSYALPEKEWDQKKLSQHRRESAFGQRVVAEQGIIIFRNSWGDVPGLNGYQAMTFDYYLAHLMLQISSKDSGLSVAGRPPRIKIDNIVIDRIKAEATEVFCK